MVDASMNTVSVMGAGQDPIANLIYAHSFAHHMGCAITQPRCHITAPFLPVATVTASGPGTTAPHQFALFTANMAALALLMMMMVLDVSALLPGLETIARIGLAPVIAVGMGDASIINANVQKAGSMTYAPRPPASLVARIMEDAGRIIALACAISLGAGQYATSLNAIWIVVGMGGAWSLRLQ